MKNKFTKGPWAIEPQHYQNNKNKKVYDLFIIGAEKGMVISITSRGEVNELDKANAQLIAAAPELLGALEKIIHELWLDDMSNFDKTQINALKLGMSAIKKARGEA